MTPSTRSRTRLAFLASTAAVLIAAAGTALGQAPGPGGAAPIAMPPAAAAVERLLSAPYLSEDEKKDLRIFHGQWRESDLDTPARMARAALIRGDYLDDSFGFDGVDPVDRAEALLMSGKPSEALAALEAGGADSIRAQMIGARALEMLGRFGDAVEVIDGALQRGVLRTAEDVVCGVRMLAQRIRLRGTDEQAADAVAGGGDGARLKADAQAYHQMVEALGRVRTPDAQAGGAGGGRLYWPALLAEAELLYSRDNAPKAQEALSELLSLNPACAQAWFMLGRMSVDAFNFETTEAVALRLDALAGNPAPVMGEGENEQEAEPVAGASPEAAIIRARAAIRQVDGAHAAAVLDQLLERYPTHPHLLAVRAAAEATRFEFDAMRERLAAYDRLFGASPLALHEAGKALSESRQYAESAEVLTEAHRRLPAAPEILSDLGLMCVQWGKDVEALEALEKAHALDPFNLRVDNSLRLVRELVTYAKVESEHFILRFKPGVDEVFARDLLGPMEENHALVSGDGPGGVDHQPFGGQGKTIIDLMPDHAWFGVRIAGMPAIHTIAASTGPVIAMEAPREGPGHNGRYDWKRVLRHEYTHTVNLDRTKNRIPHWFTEAGAVYMELSPRDYQTCLLLRDVYEADALFDFTEINVAFVRPKKPTDRAQGYAQGHWMYEFIIERWGNKAPLDLMDQYARGVREEEAFRTVLGAGREEFMAQFKPWARGELVKWGMLPPEGMPRVRELLAKEGAGDDAGGEGVEGDAGQEDDEAAQARAEGGEAGRPKVDARRRRPSGKDGGAGANGRGVTAEMVERWLEQYPAHPDLLELALDERLSETGGRATPALAPLLERYAAARPVDPKPHRLLAQMYLSSPEPAEQELAIEHLEYLDAREQKTPAYATELAKRYFARAMTAASEADQKADLGLAQAKAERATQIAPYEAPPRELAAAIAIKSGDLETAERHVWALTKLEPGRGIHEERLKRVREMRK